MLAIIRTTLVPGNAPGGVKPENLDGRYRAKYMKFASSQYDNLDEARQAMRKILLKRFPGHRIIIRSQEVK